MFIFRGGRGKSIARFFRRMFYTDVLELRITFVERPRLPPRISKPQELIVRGVKVNRGLTPQEVITATGRDQCGNRELVPSMPRGEGEVVDVHFFTLDRGITHEDLEKEFELRGLKPDPYAQAQVNADNPTFANDKPNGAQWKDGNGTWYGLFFFCYGGDKVTVNSFEGCWADHWWFAGVSK